MATELSKYNASNPSALATARWATADETGALAFEPGRIWFGYEPDSNRSAVGFSDDRHVCLVSGSRGGKGASIIIPNLLLWPGSIVVVDPKGENATVAANRRGRGSERCDGLGQTVHVLDPFTEARVGDVVRARFNPLSCLSVDDPESVDEAARIADAIIVPSNKNEPYWDNSARTLLKAIILYVVSNDSFEPHQRNLITVRDLLVRGEPAVEDAIRERVSEDGGAADDALTPHSAMFRYMEMSEAFAGVVRGYGSQFRNQAENAPKAFDGVLSVASLATEFIDSPGMKACLADSDFSLRELKSDPNGVSVFLTLPQRFMGTHKGWLRMMVTLIVTEMERERGPPRSGHRVLMVLDEFAGLGKIEALETATAQIAGHGVKLMFVVQSLTQLRQTYDHNWELFISNAATKIFFQLEDDFTRQYVSKLIGDTELRS